MATERGVYSANGIINNGIIKKKNTARKLETVHFSSCLYILMQKAVILSTCHIFRRFFFYQEIE